MTDLRTNDCHVVSTSTDQVWLIPLDHEGERRTAQDAEQLVKERVNPDNDDAPWTYYEGVLSEYVEGAYRDGEELINP